MLMYLQYLVLSALQLFVGGWSTSDALSCNECISQTLEFVYTGDVGLARIMDASHMTTGLAPCGTFAYAAPELLMGTRCDEKVSPSPFFSVLVP